MEHELTLAENSDKTQAASSSEIIGPSIGGKYRLLRLLGKGGMGEVWLAQDPSIQKKVAIKLLNANFVNNREVLDRFRREALAVNQIHHPNLLEIFAMEESDDGRPYLVMEYLEGESLAAFLKERAPLPLSEILSIFAPICEALHAAHQGGITHRDLKPDNIFLQGKPGEPPFIKVLDFGLAKLADSDQNLTRTGMIFGTPYYMSPEQCQSSKDTDQRTDIYALGTILYEMLCGSTPFGGTGAGPASIMVKQVTAKVPPISSLLAESPPKIDAFFEKALAKDPKERFSSTIELLEALKKLLAEPPVSGKTLASAPDSMIGRTIGSYKTTALLGKGGMGQVLRAKHTQIGKEVAIKLLLPELAQNEELLQRFFQEAKAVNDIHNEHILDILDMGKTPEGESYLVMELLQGEPLTNLLRREPRIAPERLAHIALQLCTALHAAHEKGIIHRDLKSDNAFLVTKAGQADFVKLLDFGLAKIEEGAVALTKIGAVMGTPLYMSPEQSLGAKVDLRTDLYALGVLLYQMATGRPPFYANSPSVLLRMHITAPVPPPRSIRPELSPALEAVILRCLEKDPKDRYQSALGLAVDLAKAVGLNVERYFGQKAQPTMMISGGKKRTIALVVTSTLLVAVSSVAALSFFKDKEAPSGASLIESSLSAVPFQSPTSSPTSTSAQEPASTNSTPISIASTSAPSDPVTPKKPVVKAPDKPKETPKGNKPLKNKEDTLGNPFLKKGGGGN